MTIKLTGRRCQCTICGEVFNTESGFDRHRTGSYAEGRTCLTPADLREKGWKLSERGIWMQEGQFTRPVQTAQQ